MTLDKNAFDFLKKLSKNNSRDWFNKHKADYETAREQAIVFADSVLKYMRTHDEIENENGKASLFRIYRDVRFSKDKTPYQTCWHGYFKRAGKKLRGGYYFHLAPGNTYIGGGFWGPNKDELSRIRVDIEYNHEDWRKMLANKKLKTTFGAMQGEQLKTAPQGFPKDHEAVDLLRYKQFTFRHDFTDKDILAKDFDKTMSNAFKNLRPFFDYMSDVLTTDANGISLLD